MSDAELTPYLGYVLHIKTEIGGQTRITISMMAGCCLLSENPRHLTGPPSSSFDCPVYIFAVCTYLGITYTLLLTFLSIFLFILKKSVVRIYMV